MSRPLRKRRVLWLLSGPLSQASSRLHGYLIHEHLLRMGWESTIVFSPERVVSDISADAYNSLRNYSFTPRDVVVFQKVHGPNTVRSLEFLRDANTSTLYVDCDLPLKEAESRLACKVICTSDLMADHYRRLGVRDVFALCEMYEACRPPRLANQSTLRCVWFGNMTLFKAAEVGVMRKRLKDFFPAFELIVVSNQFADHHWSLPAAWDIIAACDIALITADRGQQAAYKSPNRLVQAMALGLPTIASAIPAYSAITKNYRNAILCSTNDEWLDALRAMEDGRFRYRVATAGFRYARRYFSPQKVLPEWERALVSLCRDDGH